VSSLKEINISFVRVAGIHLERLAQALNGAEKLAITCSYSVVSDEKKPRSRPTVSWVLMSLGSSILWARRAVAERRILSLELTDRGGGFASQLAKLLFPL